MRAYFGKRSDPKRSISSVVDRRSDEYALSDCTRHAITCRARARFIRINSILTTFNYVNAPPKSTACGVQNDFIMASNVFINVPMHANKIISPSGHNT